MSRGLDFNPAGGYLKELRARGLVRATQPGNSVDLGAATNDRRLPLGRVLEAASVEPRSLSEVQDSAGLPAEDVVAAVQSLAAQDLVRIVDSGKGPAVKLTADGEATLDATR